MSRGISGGRECPLRDSGPEGPVLEPYRMGLLAFRRPRPYVGASTAGPCKVA